MVRQEFFNRQDDLLAGGFVIKMTLPRLKCLVLEGSYIK